MDVAAWLRGLGLEQYAQLFRDNDIDGEILCGMTAEDLKVLGISSFGHRRRLLNAITALGGEPPTRDMVQSATSATPAPIPPPLAYLEQIGALKPSSTLSTIWCAACDKDHDATVELDVTGKARHFCPDAGWVDDSDDDLASRRLDREWLLDWLERTFSVMPPRRRRMLLSDRIWHIGEAVLGRTSVTVIFARGFIRRSELYAAIMQVPPTEVGVVLSTAAEVAADFLAVYGYYAVNLDQILLPKKMD
jgi:hypothetical protein